jgi:hypothetical protein
MRKFGLEKEEEEEEGGCSSIFPPAAGGHDKRGFLRLAGAVPHAATDERSSGEVQCDAAGLWCHECGRGASNGEARSSPNFSYRLKSVLKGAGASFEVGRYIKTSQTS